MTLHVPEIAASNKSAECKVDGLHGVFFFVGGDLSRLAGGRSTYCIGEKTDNTKTFML